MRRFVFVMALALLAGCGVSSGPSEVQVSVTDNGFEPKNVVIKKGQAAVLVITRKTENTCATEAIFTETGKKYELPLNTPVRIDLTGSSPGTIHYACGMDMEHGTVTIQ
jgi:plastocyanin domain-containing protein